jgi:hypothetical protein
LSTRDDLDLRPLVLLAVLLSHVVIVHLIIRAARQGILLPNNSHEPLILMLLHEKATAPMNAATARRRPISPRPATSSAYTPKGKSEPEEPEHPNIDWQHEAELAAENGVAAAEKEKHYRDLSALSPAQLSWVTQNRMRRAPAGIKWQHPRFEFDRESGLPILWINDHCVLVTLLVFCRIGHIEPNGDLFSPMADPRE